MIGLSALMTLAIIAAAFTLTYVSATRILEQETAEVVEAELRGIVERVDLRDPRTLVELNPRPLARGGGGGLPSDRRGWKQARRQSQRMA